MTTSLSLSKVQDIVPTRTFPITETASHMAVLTITQLYMLSCSSSSVQLTLLECDSSQPALMFLSPFLVMSEMTQKEIYTPELTEAEACSQKQQRRGRESGSSEQKLDCNSARERPQPLLQGSSGWEDPSKLFCLGGIGKGGSRGGTRNGIAFEM